MLCLYQEVIMKKIFLCLLVIVVMFVSVEAKDKYNFTIKRDVVYETMQFSLFVGNLVDLGLTRHALDRYPLAYESNPISNLYINRPALSILITATASILQYHLFSKMRKTNKIIAYVFLGMFVAIKAYIIYHNMGVIDRARGYYGF